MRKLVLVLAVALAAAACGTPDPVVATVNGVDIHQSDVLELRSIDPEAVRMNSSEFRNELFGIIAQQVLATSLDAEFGEIVTPDEVEAELAQRLADTGTTEEEAIASLQDPAATRERLLRIVYSQLLGDRARAALASREGVVEEIFAESPELVTTVCARHILVASEEEAVAAAALITAGEDFAAVADEVSLDAGVGGDLGCRFAGTFVPEFSDATLVAPIGEVFGPVETDFGFHLIEVSERSVPSLAEVEADPQGTLPPDLLQSEFTTWFNDQVQAAEISVLPRIGSWFPEGPGILPPDG